MARPRIHIEVTLNQKSTRLQAAAIDSRGLIIWSSGLLVPQWHDDPQVLGKIIVQDLGVVLRVAQDGLPF